MAYSGMVAPAMLAPILNPQGPSYGSSNPMAGQPGTTTPTPTPGATSPWQNLLNNYKGGVLSGGATAKQVNAAGPVPAWLQNRVANAVAPVSGSLPGSPQTGGTGSPAQLLLQLLQTKL